MEITIAGRAMGAVKRAAPMAPSIKPIFLIFLKGEGVGEAKRLMMVCFLIIFMIPII
jgi:hypothetical protein